MRVLVFAVLILGGCGVPQEESDSRVSVPPSNTAADQTNSSSLDLASTARPITCQAQVVGEIPLAVICPVKLSNGRVVDYSYVPSTIITIDCLVDKNVVFVSRNFAQGSSIPKDVSCSVRLSDGSVKSCVVKANSANTRCQIEVNRALTDKLTERPTPAGTDPQPKSFTNFTGTYEAGYPSLDYQCYDKSTRDGCGNPNAFYINVIHRYRELVK